MKIKQFNRQTVRELREAINEALEKVSKEYGVSIGAKNASFSEGNVSFKLEAAVKTNTGEVLTKEAEDFKRYSGPHGHGVPANKLFSTFEVQGRTLKLTGYKPRSPKFPFLATDKAGNTYKLPPVTVKQALGLETSPLDGFTA